MKDAAGTTIRVGDRVSRVSHNSGGAYLDLVGQVTVLEPKRGVVWFARRMEPARFCTKPSKLLVVLPRIDVKDFCDECGREDCTCEDA